MFDIALIVVGSLVGGLGVILFVAARAPVGYQDHSGFHYGPDAHEPVEEFHDAVPELSR